MQVHEFVAVQLTGSGSQLEAPAVHLTGFVARRKVGTRGSFNRLWHGPLYGPSESRFLLFLLKDNLVILQCRLDMTSTLRTRIAYSTPGASGEPALPTSTPHTLPFLVGIKPEGWPRMGISPPWAYRSLPAGQNVALRSGCLARLDLKVPAYIPGSSRESDVQTPRVTARSPCHSEAFPWIGHQQPYNALHTICRCKAMCIFIWLKPASARLVRQWA